MLGSIVRSAMASLPFSVRYELFYQAGRSLDVESYGVNGQAGLIVGPLYDQAAIKPYLRHRRWQPNVTDMIIAALRETPDATFVDVGANIGLVSIPVARAGHRVVAIEPDPGNASLLRANVARAELIGMIDVRQVAAADRAATLRFAHNPYNCGDHHLAPDGDIDVAALPLDQIAPNGPLVIKVDTQGAEPAVFSGGASALARASLLISEFWPAGIARMGGAIEPVIDGLRRHFSHAAVMPDKGAPTEWRPVGAFCDDLMNFTGGDTRFMDFAAVKR